MPTTHFIRWRSSISPTQAVALPSSFRVISKSTSMNDVGPVMVKDIPFNSSGNPSTQHADQCRLDDVLTVNKIVSICLVDRIKNAATNLGKDAHLHEFVFEVNGVIGLRNFLIAELVDECIRINGSLCALIRPAIEENGIAFGRPAYVGMTIDSCQIATHDALSLPQMPTASTDPISSQRPFSPFFSASWVLQVEFSRSPRGH